MSEKEPAKVQEYSGGGLTVTYDPKICIHAAECVRGLPEVFDPEARPWIRVEAAGREKIVEVVGRCPSGALQARIEGEDVEASEAAGGEEVPAAAGNEVEVLADGPLRCRGVLRLVGGEANADEEIYLCRCGASSNKPFCDGSHTEAGFADPGELSDPQIRGEGEGDGPLQIMLAANGPLVLSGPVELIGASGRCRGDRTALCRCGASANKPFCDGAHTRIGFQA